MCGIVGVIGEFDLTAAEAAVRRMISALERRGPDSEGIVSWDSAVLGHRRLAIFDLSEAGHQPMVSSDRSVGVVFNGAIYNHRELRKHLMARGYRFKSRTDTEVLIHGYTEWGLDKLVSKLRGMFAFGLWDNSVKKLYLVRDRLGVKPLVFYRGTRCIAFASTLRALRAAGFVNQLDENAVIDFLKFGFVSDDHSIYVGASKVRAGSIVEWADGIIKTRQYWVPAEPMMSDTPSFDEAVEKAEHLLLDSASVRLQADVPVAVLLSGGIDSSLVAWAIIRLGCNVTAYTIGTPGHSWDETAAAKETARRLGIEHRVLEMSEWDSPETAMEELLSAYSEPFACASALGMLRVSRAVASSAKVLLTGDGGDDVFLGYPRHRHLWLADKLSEALPCSVKRSWLVYRSAFPRIGPLRRAAALFDYTTGGLSAHLALNGLFYKANGLLGERLVTLPIETSDKSCRVDTKHRVLADFLDYERKTRFVGEYLTKVDGATMHYALEARSPFLDQFFWEFASSLPFDIRLHRGRLKAILRELARQKLGADVSRRRKRGFSIPVLRWISGRWRHHVDALLRESILDMEGWICSKAALVQLEMAARKGWAPEELWYVFVLESWLRYERQTRVYKV